MKQRSNSRKKSKESITRTQTSTQGISASRNSSTKSKKQVSGASNILNQPAWLNDVKQSRQIPMMSDLYKASTQQRAEIKELMGEIEMPDEDESLTVSSISQSPFQARNISHLYQTNNPPQQQTQKNPLQQINEIGTSINDALKNAYELHSTEHELTTLGRSDLEGTNTQKSASLKMMMFMGGTRGGGTGTMSNGMNMLSQNSYREEEGAKESEEEEDFDRRKKYKGEAQMDYEEENHGSPDFNRHTRMFQNMDDSNNTSAYDLTVSNAGGGPPSNLTPISYRNVDMTALIFGGAPAAAANQSKTATSSNRTFADSVIKHQYNQYTSSSNNNTHREPNETKGHSRIEKLNRMRRRRENGSDDDDTSRLEDEEDNITREEEEEESKGEIDPSEMSAIDSFAQTQYSKFSKHQSKMGNSRFGNRSRINNALSLMINTPAPDKSPQIIRKTGLLNQDESISLTPSTNGGKWQLTQKSYLTANNASTMSNHNMDNSVLNGTTGNSNDNNAGLNLANNRTTSSDNPLLNRLTTNIPQVLNTNRTTYEVNGMPPPHSGGHTASAQSNPITRNHNRSLQRDQELEKALEEDSENQTLKRVTIPTLEDSKSSEEAQKKAVGMNYKISKLQVEVKTLQAQRDMYANECQEKNQEIYGLQEHMQELNNTIVDKSEKLILLETKFKDEAQLPKLRQKNLQHARSQIQQLQSELLLRDQTINELQQELNRRELDEKAVYGAQKEEIMRLHGEMDTMRALMKGKERSNGEVERQFANKLQMTENSYQGKLNELQGIINTLKKGAKDLQNSVSSRDVQIQELTSQITDQEIEIEQREKKCSQLEKEKERQSNEMKGFKERCKNLELELEQKKSFENSTLFGNGFSTSSQDMARKNDYELKQIKDIYDKKLAKTGDELAKKTGLCRDLENECKRLGEEVKALQVKQYSQTSDKFDRDQEIIDELNIVKEELAQQRQFQDDVRFLFNLEEDQDLTQFLTRANHELETIPLLHDELQKLRSKLEELQRKLADRDALSNTLTSQQSLSHGIQKDTMSNFAKNMLVEKDKQIGTHLAKIKQLEETNETVQHNLIVAESQLKALTKANSDLLEEIQSSQEGLVKLGLAKEKSDMNANELKDKLRNFMREQQLQEDQRQTQVVPTSFKDVQFKQKCEELIEQVLSLDLISDPISKIGNLSLQDSFTDQVEKAQKHLEDQVQLIKANIQEHNRKEASLIDQLTSAQENAIKAESFENEVLKYQRIVKEKEKCIEVSSVEVKALSESCEKQVQMLKEVEACNAKLRIEVESANLNLRKALRAQEITQSSIPKPLNQPQLIERLMMTYEDQIEKTSIHAKNKCEEMVIEALNFMTESNEIIKSGISQYTICRIKEIIERVREQESLKQRQDFDESERRENCLEMSISQRPSTLQEQSHPYITKNFGFQNQNDQQNHDNSMLVFSELLTPNLPAHITIIEYEQKIQEKLEQLQIADDQIKVMERKIHQLTQQLETNEFLLKEQEELVAMKVQSIEEQSVKKNQQMWQDVENLKEQVLKELLIKGQKLDQEYEDLQIQKVQCREELSRQKKDLDHAYSSKLQAQEKQFLEKLQQVEKDLRTSSEQSKEASVASIYHQLREQKDSQIKALEEDQISQITLLKADFAQKLDEQKRIKEREMKKLRDESDRARKSGEDKIKKFENDALVEREAIDREFRDKMEQMTAKHKLAIKAATEKAKAESRNQVDSIRNELAKAKAEQEREKKRLATEQQTQIDMIMREQEENLEMQLKAQKEKLDKVYKKKVEEREKEYLMKLENWEADARLSRQAHLEELKMERERVEVRVKNQLRLEVKNEVTVLLEQEYKVQFDRIEVQHQQEVERLKGKWQEQVARVEKACQLPTPHNIETRIAQVQCDIQESPEIRNSNYRQDDDDDTTGLVVINQSSIYGPNDDILEYARNPRALRESDSRIEAERQNGIYVQQLKANYESELEKQQQVFEVQLISRQQSSIRIFEELLTLEFDKILESIYSKQSGSNKLESKRREINNLISEILARNDDRRERQMKSSLDALKIKISEVLKVFKGELDFKFSKKLQNQERVMSRDVSDIVSTSCRPQLSYQECLDDISIHQRYNDYSQEEDTPRQGVANHLDHFTQAQNYSIDQQYSDVKNYATEDDQMIQNAPASSGNQILRRITPMPNSKGVLVVEVDKVLRDLKMLMRTIKQAKFYHMLVDDSEDTEDVEGNDEDQQRGSNNESSLQRYREILNSLIKLVVKMNGSAESLSKQNDLYKVRLINADLRSQIKKVQSQLDASSITVMADDILNFYSLNQQPYEILCKEAHQCLSILENAQFTTNKQHFKMFQLKDLFMTKDIQNGTSVNRNMIEVNRLCVEYAKHHSQEFNDALRAQTEADLLQSQAQYSPSKIKIAPELLSPEETAQLIASVFQKFNSTQMTTGNISNQNLQQTNNSFFQTFLSSEENIRSAESFIQKYREQLLNCTQKTGTSQRGYRNLPLQVTQRSHESHLYSTNQTQQHQNDSIISRSQQFPRGMHQYQSNHLLVSDQNYTDSRMRSRSQNSNSSRGNSGPRNTNQSHFISQAQPMTATTNIFLSNNHDNHTHSAKSLIIQPSQSDTQSSHFASIQNYPPFAKNTHQQSINSNFQTAMTTVTTVSKANQPYQSIQLKANTSKHTASTGSLFNQNINSLNIPQSNDISKAQGNVNMLFDKMKNAARYNS